MHMRTPDKHAHNRPYQIIEAWCADGDCWWVGGVLGSMINDDD